MYILFQLIFHTLIHVPMVILCAILVPDDGHIAMNKADEFLEFAASLARWLLGTNSKKKKKKKWCLPWRGNKRSWLCYGRSFSKFLCIIKIEEKRVILCPWNWSSIVPWPVCNSEVGGAGVGILKHGHFYLWSITTE